MRRALAAAAIGLLLAGPALAAHGKPKPLGPPEQRLTEAQAKAIFLRNEKVSDWLTHYPKRLWQTDASFDQDHKLWRVNVWAGAAGEVATGKVDDTSGAVAEGWTGPQVAWKMARGLPGAFGGKEINSAPVWLGFCALFLLGLADLRRPFSLRNLDLLVLLSFTVSLWFFNRGDIFTSVPLAYPPMAYLLCRMVWTTWRGGPQASRSVWPVWAIAAGAVFLTGFRAGLNLRESNVIDVGY